MSAPEYLLAIDPGAAAGWALFEKGKLQYWGQARGSMWHTFKEDLWPLDSNTATYAQGICIIEQGWLNRSKSAITLSQRRGLAQAAAEACGFRKFEFIASATWQNGIYGSIHGKDTKLLSLRRVQLVHKKIDLSHDICDAINIGDWYLENAAHRK